MKNGAAMAPESASAKRRRQEDGGCSAKAEEREHGDHDYDQTDDVDDGIHGEDSSC
jgi:hypothetical protein